VSYLYQRYPALKLGHLYGGIGWLPIFFLGYCTCIVIESMTGRHDVAFFHYEEV
jgi:hypothetical protein